ncbi:hypothetical protein [Methanogenium organophilum]|uniref:Fibronectin type-III domain-containing protein n=1 Tax=Methanogenium organophilum TaxID=2199 RepID=A0A9X9S2N3_METOG|nr:hypothetical protein [Methanogenium organophilum]WAI00693.1 hypothetical protein OU421_09690 [Methanogenium organophilum]
MILLLCVTGATAAGAGTLSASDVTDVALGESGVVTYTLTNDFDPKVGTLTYTVYYDETIATAVSAKKIAIGVGPIPDVLENGMAFTITDTDGLANGETDLFNVTFTSNKNDGSSMDLGIVVTNAKDVSLPPTDLKNSIIIANGTFTTRDVVAPVIGPITTPVSVGENFQITGPITEVGGMGTATATIANATYTSPSIPLILTDLGNGAYTYTADVSWPVFENGVVIAVNAVDAAGNVATAQTKTINVVDVGFSNPSPADGSYINIAPTEASVFMSQIDTSTVAMTLGDGSTTTNLVVAIDGDYARGAIPVLGDGIYWVNVTGTDTIASEERYLNWTYTLDTSAPTLDVTITDSDGDGYIEANEVLTFDWAVSSPGISGFKNVEIVDTVTSEVLWSDTNADSSATQNFPAGNRDLSFRAYDNAGNYAAHDFHLYNNYVVWVNSTKIGTIGGLNTEFTSAVDLDLTATSMIELYNGRSVFAPEIGTITRQVRDVGQVTSDTFVTVDNRANATYAGTDTYQELWVYNPTEIIDFEITAPSITRASVVMVEANESYLNELIDSESTSNIDYTQLVKQTAYIFIDDGWTQITVNEDGSFTQDNIVGAPLTVSGDITATLKNSANQVDLSSGFRMSVDSVGFDASTNPPVGDYAVAAIAFDGDRIGGIAVMPVVILETADEGTLSTNTVALDGTFDASFGSDCKYFGVALYRDTVYNATATVDFANLNLDMVTVDLSVGGAATEQLWHNIYITPGAGKYAAVKNGNSLTFDVTGLEAGNYKVVLAGLSNSGTAQAFGVHDVTIGSALNISEIVATPYIYNAGIQWTTNLAANSTVEYGTTVAYGNNVSDASYVLTHNLLISGLSPVTQYHYRIISVDEFGNTAVTPDATFVTLYPGGGGGGGGGSGGSIVTTTPVQEFNTTGYLQTDSSGIVRGPVLINAADGLSFLYIAQGVQALKANGQPVVDITIQPTDDVPPSGSSVFSFAGHAVTLGPSGATFSPAIELTFQLTEEEWNALKDGETFTIKWFNDGTGEWENIQTSVNQATHTVTGKISHFSTFAVFTQSIESLTPAGTEQTPTPTDVPGETPVPTETGGEGTETGGFPWVWVVVVIVLIAVIGGGYYFTQQKKE